MVKIFIHKSCFDIYNKKILSVATSSTKVWNILDSYNEDEKT